MWKTISIIEASILVIFAVFTVNAIGVLPEGCIATGLDGRYLCWQEPTIPIETLKFDLSHWKLQIPGPLDINPIGDYTSKYFYYGDGGEMIFWVDSSEKGATENSSYVRSELREMLDPSDKTVNWLLRGTHTLTAELEVIKAGAPKITVLQIHGIKTNGDNAPPLLKVVVEGEKLYALLKKDSSGDNEEKILLQEGVKKFATEIKIKDYQLTIKVNNTLKLSRSLLFWKYYNYFKAGNYPQATSGISEVRFYDLRVSH